MKLKLLILFTFLSKVSFSQIDSLTYYYQENKLEKAIKYGEKIISFYNENPSDKDEGYVNTISWLAFLNTEIKKNSEKEKYFKLLEENISFYNQNFEAITHNYFLIANNYSENQNNEFAEIYLLKAINLSELKNIIGEVYYNSLNLLGDIYINQNKFDKAVICSKKCLDIAENIYDKNSEKYIIALSNVAQSFLRIENFKEAESTYLKCIKISNDINNKELQLEILNNTVLMFLTNKDIFQADFYNNIGLSLSQNNDLLIKYRINFIHNKAIIEFEIGKIDNSEKLYLEVLKYYLDHESDYYDRIFKVTNDLGFINLKNKKYTKAEYYFKNNFESKKRFYKNDSIKLISSLNALINLYWNLSDNEKALEYSLISYNIIRNDTKYNQRLLSETLNVLATTYALMKDIKKAELYYLKSLEIKNKLFGKNNLNNLILYNNLLYITNGNIVKHQEYLYLYLNTLNKLLIKSSENLSENENLIFNSTILPNNSHLSFLLKKNKYFSKSIIAIYENQLLLKNLSIRNQQRIKTTIEKNGDATVKQKYQQFIDNKRYITKIEELPVAQRPATYDQLKTETESLEKELTRLSATFAEAKKSLAVSWKQIQEKLKPNEVVIDLVSFNYYNKKWTDSIMYGAFVIKKDSKFPKFVNLFEEKQLAVLLERNNKAHDSIQSKIINKQYSDKEISNLFYKPLEAELKNGNTIYLAPSGLAHQINFKALPVNTNQTLGEKYKLILLGTTTTLVDYKPLTINKKDNFEIVLYGGINYNKKQVEVYKEAYPNELNDLATRSGILEFNYLPGTNDEVNKINKEAITYNFKTTIKTESAATEESVKQLSGKANPFILHLATHGFFFENTKQELSDLDKNIPVEAKKRIYLASEDPMMRSGLLLAGANNSWRKTNNETNADDGILTAKEIANLDLSNCKLVVLSACETGLGQINGSEGVFGLQRAFKMAGVQNIIMSLWKVPDVQSAELFEIFYAACFNGKSIQEAFNEAQNKMKEKYSPYYWAGFVLLE
ncbi:CHAT domain-containing protein [Flavobacterium sp.]|uniref:CHAT domain-containing protein n=1 Tax=Flavobacterium sp. TaxID=239 RepID=UPI003D12ADD5